MQNITDDDWKEINKRKKEQGNLHESAALKSIGGDAINLNGNVMENFPTFDISSSQEICSVKSHISQDGVLTDQNISSYLHDFEHMLGWDRDMAYNELDGKLLPIEQDAKRIAELQGRGAPIPESLSNASSDQIVDYLKHDTVMRIPQDHVSAVQDEIERKAREIPENYYLSNPPTDNEITVLRDRVKPTGLTAGETLNQLNIDNSNVKSGQLVYEGPDPQLATPPSDASKREYLVGSIHKDIEDSKGILEAGERYKLGQQLNTAQIGTPLENLQTASSAIISSQQVNQESLTQTQMDQYFHDKHGHDPYTTPAYPLSDQASLTDNKQNITPTQSTANSSEQSLSKDTQANSEDNSEDYYYSYGQ